nr:MULTISPECIES: DUF982 domain-containing protein [unclassified Mesorhizobium]
MLSKPFEKSAAFGSYWAFPVNSTRSPAIRAATARNRKRLRACKAALVGDVDSEPARGIFVAFAHL